jgi:hypothetical protein
MCNKEHLVGYLYDELTATEKAAFETHIDECAECRQEVDVLRQTRHHLSSWSPPEPEVTFTVVQTKRAAEPARKPVRWVPFVPQWGLAAAAVMVVAGAMAIANVEVRYEKDGSLVVRTGWSARPPAVEVTGATAQADAFAAASEELRTALTVLQQRLQTVEQSFQQLQSAEQTRLAGARDAISTSDLRKILAEREGRFRTEMALHTEQIWKDFSAARVNDWARVQQAVGQVQGLTNRQLQQTRESIDSLRYLTVSQQK